MKVVSFWVCLTHPDLPNTFCQGDIYSSTHNPFFNLLLALEVFFTHQKSQLSYFWRFCCLFLPQLHTPTLQMVFLFGDCCCTRYTGDVLLLWLQQLASLQSKKKNNRMVCGAVVFPLSDYCISRFYCTWLNRFTVNQMDQMVNQMLT